MIKSVFYKWMIGKELTFAEVFKIRKLCKKVILSLEVTKRVYFIGNERMLIDHDSNRLRFS